MSIAPLEGGEQQAREERLRLIVGGRRPDAGPRGRAAHARADARLPSRLDAERAAELRRARGAHPSSWAASPARGLPTRATRAARPGTAIVMDPEGRVGRSVRPSAAVRRRRVAGLAVVLVSLVLLAMPLRALGAVTVLGQQTPAGVPAGLAPGSTYVVQPGDTLRTIAARVNPGAVARIASELATETGSPNVVAGEHVRIPFG